MKNLFSVISRHIDDNVIVLCLENGIVAEGKSKEEALHSLIDAIESFKSACIVDKSILKSTISIKELHEFLSYEGKLELSYELNPIYA